MKERPPSPDRGSEEGLKIVPGTILRVSADGEEGAFFGYDKEGTGEALFSRLDAEGKITGEEIRVSGPDEIRRLNPDYKPPEDEPVDFGKLRDIEDEAA